MDGAQTRALAHDAAAPTTSATPDASFQSNDAGELRVRSAFLKYLFAFASPLFLAAKSRKKKKPVKKPTQRIVRKKYRVSKRPARGASAKKAALKPPKKLARAAAKAKPAPAPKKSEDDEPLPKPVAPFGRAILLVPKDGTYVDSFHPTFRWLSVGGATRYEVQWGEDATLGNKYGTVSLATEATVPVEKPLRVGAIYYWRVRGGNDGGWGPWSPIGSFRVLEETP